jgi:hypothetical protein
MNHETVSALEEALQDEYKSRATYHAVIAAFGRIRPFVNIVQSEERHVAALLSLFDKYGLKAPEDKWRAHIEPPSTVAAACQDGVRAEIENGEMYERLLAAVDEPDVRAVLLRLQSASRTRHLPAFRRCLGRGQDRNMKRCGRTPPPPPPRTRI